MGETVKNIHRLKKCYSHVIWVALFTLPLSICTIPAAASFPPEEENSGPALSYGSDLDINSRYLWRGMVCNDRAVAQPSAWIALSDWSLSVWGNRGLEERYGPAVLDEVDATLDFAHGWGPYTALASVSYFHYPKQEDAPSTGEIMLGGEYSIGVLSLFTRHMVDYLEYEGGYWGEGGVSAGWTLGKTVAGEASVGLGWASRKFNESYWGAPRATLSLWSVDAALRWSPTDYLFIRPHAEFFSLLDHDLSEDANKQPVNVGLQFGFTW
ncbi:MAG: hypothetical protein PHI18_00510 [bacterium]|nr:hypothetical protein [bacterium]